MAGTAPFLAHVGGSDLPLPRWQFVYAGVALLVAAFLALRASFPRSRLAATATGRPLPRSLDTTASIAGIALRALGLILWIVALAAAWFGTEPRLTFLPWPEWKSRQASEDDATATWEHIIRSPNCSIAKAEQRLGYAPRYSSFAAVEQAVSWLIGEGKVEV